MKHINNKLLFLLEKKNTILVTYVDGSILYCQVKICTIRNVGKKKKVWLSYSKHPKSHLLSSFKQKIHYLSISFIQLQQDTGDLTQFLPWSEDSQVDSF